jgi:lipoate-protein ligase A
MIFIETASTDPAVNLAYEEYYLRHGPRGSDILMLWHNRPTIVIGRYQSIFAEANLPYAEAHGISAFRRISGGGAVYHDPGNLCFSLIRDRSAPTPGAARLLQPIVQALTRLGLAVELTQRNDLTLAGKKFSGHAMMVQRDRLLLHGTLLFDSDLEALEQALASPFGEVETKAIHSVRSRVTNLSPWLPDVADIEQFKAALKGLMLDGLAPEAYAPAASDRTVIKSLAADKYRSWDWTFGADPASRVRCHSQYEGETVEITLDLEKGHVRQCQIESKAPDPAEWAAVARQLTDVRFDKASVQAALKGSSRGQCLSAFLAGYLPSDKELQP